MYNLLRFPANREKREELLQPGHVIAFVTKGNKSQTFWSLTWESGCLANVS